MQCALATPTIRATSCRRAVFRLDWHRRQRYGSRTLTHPPTPDTRLQSEFARARDMRVIWLSGQHPVTAAILVRLGWFPNRHKASKRLRRLTARGRVRLVGTVNGKTGRPEHVFCRWHPKPDQLRHEVELTELCLRLDAGVIRRGPHVTDRQVLPDAEIGINGAVYYLELDRGTMRRRQIEQRFRKYEACPHFVLWVCSTAARRDALLMRAAGLRHTALFTTFAEALAAPHGEIWLDFAGTRVALPREDEHSHTQSTPD